MSATSSPHLLPVHGTVHKASILSSQACLQPHLLISCPYMVRFTGPASSPAKQACNLISSSPARTWYGSQGQHPLRPSRPVTSSPHLLPLHGLVHKASILCGPACLQPRLLIPCPYMVRFTRPASSPAQHACNHVCSSPAPTWYSSE